MKIKVAITEDEKNYSQTLKKIIDLQEDMETVLQAFTGQDAITNLPLVNPDVAIMDIQLPDMLGINVVENVKHLLPDTQFIMCTSFEDEDKVFDSLKAGATGYLVKGESLDKILSSIRDAYNGGAPMSFSIARRVLKYFEIQRGKIKDLPELSEREVEILDLLSQGLLYKEIAEKRCISIDTVKKHVGHIYRKLQVSNKTEAINKFNQYKY